MSPTTGNFTALQLHLAAFGGGSNRLSDRFHTRSTPAFGRRDRRRFGSVVSSAVTAAAGSLTRSGGGWNEEALVHEQHQERKENREQGPSFPF